MRKFSYQIVQAFRDKGLNLEFHRRVGKYSWTVDGIRKLDANTDYYYKEVNGNKYLYNLNFQERAVITGLEKVWEDL